MDPDKFARRQAKREARRMRRCQHKPEHGMVFGALIVGIGLMMLLANIGIVVIRDLWSCWPLALVALGIVKGLRSTRTSGQVTASLICAAGALLMLRNLNLIAFDYRLDWPVLIIGFGVAKLAAVLDRPGSLVLCAGSESSRLCASNFRTALHGFGHAGMFEDHRGPGWLGDHRIEQRQQALLAIEDRQFHRQRLGLADLDPGLRVFVQALAMGIVERTQLQQQPAHHSARAGLLHQLLVQRIHRIRRA